MRQALLFLLLGSCLSLAGVDPAGLPDPRPMAWTVVSGVSIGAQDRAALDRLCADVHAATGAELAVVAVDSTGGRPHRAAATALFNRWGLGDAGRDDGILVFAALADRRVEIILGDGVDDDRQVAISQEIVNQEMLPRFRANDQAGALFRGAEACARRILGWNTPAPVAAEAPRATRPAPVVDLELAGTPAATPPAEQEPAHRPVTTSAGLRMGDTISGQTIHRTSGMSGDVSVVLLVFLVIGVVVLLVGLSAYARHRTRTCPACNIPMVRLGEAEDDAHLQAAERTEENIGSVDYDVWQCPTCRRVHKLSYSAWFSGYATCPRCQARTRSSTESTLRAATEDHGGLERIDERCVHCDYRNSYTRSTPRLQRRSSGSRLSSGGSGFSSSGGSGGGGSSGGSSSGRGGGGSW